MIIINAATSLWLRAHGKQPQKNQDYNFSSTNQLAKCENVRPGEGFSNYTFKHPRSSWRIAHVSGVAPTLLRAVGSALSSRSNFVALAAPK